MEKQAVKITFELPLDAAALAAIFDAVTASIKAGAQATINNREVAAPTSTPQAPQPEPQPEAPAEPQLEAPAKAAKPTAPAKTKKAPVKAEPVKGSTDDRAADEKPAKAEKTPEKGQETLGLSDESAADEPAAAPTMSEARSLVVKLVQGGKHDEVKAALKAAGATTVSNLTEEALPGFMQSLNAIAL